MSVSLRQLEHRRSVRASAENGGGASHPDPRQQLRKAILAEYLEKLPDFIPLRSLPEISGRSLQELQDDIDSGLLKLTKHNGFIGMAPRRNVPFLGTLTLLRTRSVASPADSPDASTEQITVSVVASHELAQRASLTGRTVATIVDEILNR
ncbi:hypothetical protein ACFQ9V_17615 [Leifsonia sp. NPDC056665]|uniref:hypothetical protein n=1 Tax=Leifsonia sp. NPDC056665 TaxID=3345901 RepID=UPI0036B8AB80